MEILMSNNIVEKCRWHNAEFLMRSSRVVELGKNILGPTALTNGHSITKPDVLAIDKFFLINMAYSSSFGNLIEHCRFAGDIAFNLVLAVNEKGVASINPEAQKSALNLHDLGRFGTHSFMETDELTDIYWKEIGLRQDLKHMTHSAHLYWSNCEIDFQNLSVSERISIVSDIFGKRSQNDPTRLRHKEEILEAVRSSKKKYMDKPDPTPYEKELIARLPEYTRKEEYTITKTLEWFDGLGIDINAIVDKVFIETMKRKSSK